MAKTRSNSPVDEYVGSRVRARRKALEMNQTTLGKKLGVTFQMVQRYEYGLCRISASTLYTIAFALDCPIEYFFEGLPLPSGKKLELGRSEAASQLLVKTHYGRSLAVLFPRIASRGSQRAIVELVRAIAAEHAAV
jgi:transcriptional regulator with XRE-family HTH domain